MDPTETVMYECCGPDLIKALIAAKLEFLPIKKDSINPFFKNKYASLDSILEATDPALAKHGIFISQPVVYVEGKSFLRTIVLHESGQHYSSDYPLSEHDKPQELGSEITYARRYSRCSVLGVTAEDDEDGPPPVAPPQKRSYTKKADAPNPNGPPDPTMIVDSARDIVGDIVAPTLTKEDRLAAFKSRVSKEFGSFNLTGNDKFSKAVLMMIRETFQADTWNEVLIMTADQVKGRMNGRWAMALERTKAAYPDAVQTEVPF